METPMMECGHAANSLLTRGDTQVPACVICHGTNPGATVIAEAPPDLSARRARCTYYGRVPSGRSHESNHGCKRGEPCRCEEPSSDGVNLDGPPRLAFFQHQPDEDHDSFYCGCWGWD